jgi:hypothetical protein
MHAIAIYQGVNVIKRQCKVEKYVVSKMNEMLEAAILGGANDDDIEETVHHFISNLFRSNRTQIFLNCKTVDI